ncbi:MAG: methyl-accepting chemotaxis protein [Sterolibacterium sp.]|nr:methyl-accepting chemotaxis protein [Sterolibacterium sp.]
MKINSPVTRSEKTFPPGVSLYSRTNLKGQIEEINDPFVEMSGFTREELIDKAHNIIRHPDMPPAAFADLWRDLKAGRPWRGIVKNWRRDGGFYWVVANASPIRNLSGEVTGYQSVRFAPSAEEIRAAEDAYRRIRKGDKSLRVEHGRVIARKTALEQLLSEKSRWGFMVAVACAPAVCLLTGVNALPLAVFSLLYVPGFVVYNLRQQRQAQQELLTWCEQMLISGDLTLPVPTKLLHNPQVSELAGGLQDFVSAMRATVKGVEDVARQVAEIVHETELGVTSIHQASCVQSDATASSAATIEEVTVSISEVAAQTEATREASLAIGEEAQAALSVSDEAAQHIHMLAEYIQTTARQIESLGQRSEEINRIVGLIREIADQTNLLALNAAIEAARAGEQGRGFAVVADEVRKLAERTSKATEEIGCMIGAIREDAGRAVASMSQGERQAKSSVVVVNDVGVTLRAIGNSIQQTIDKVANIAHATLEQRNAMTLMANDIEQVSVMTQNNVSALAQTKAMTERLEVVGQRMLESARQYRA